MTAILVSKKAIAFNWLGILIIMLAVGSFYILLNEPVEQIKSITKDNITGTPYEDTFNKTNTLWDYFLVVFFFMCMVFLVLSAMRRPN